MSNQWIIYYFYRLNFCKIYLLVFLINNTKNKKNIKNELILLNNNF
jgi:hypothetical protein